MTKLHSKVSGRKKNRFQKASKKASGIEVHSHNGHDFEAEVGKRKSTGGFDRKTFFEAYGGRCPSLFECVEHVRQNQPEGWDSKNPPTEIGMTFLLWTKRHFAKIVDKKSHEVGLHLYSATDLPIDYLFGVDFLVYLDDPVIVGGEHNPPFVTIDLTMRSSKPHFKADFLLCKWQVLRKGEMQELAKKVALRLHSRI